MNRLVVVESPTKARTIRKFLPDSYRVEASMGHIRDLPGSASEIPEMYKKESWARLGVNVGSEFEPIYVVPSDKKKVVKMLKDALKQADELFIATDEDREGESIGWHLLEVLNPKIPVRRMVFHEITKEAILGALEETRDMDRNLVDAQETRRVLDRLVGYSISPLLWKKIAPKLSAGRVQSVAVRLLVVREKERILFVPASYWDLLATLRAGTSSFESTLTHLADIPLATGRNFDDNTGRLSDNLVDGKDVVILKEDVARRIQEELQGTALNVVNIDERTSKRNPYAPFITSSLQQEASRKLRLSARDTMRVAQKLYENGLITYMRTDSTALSSEAVKASRRSVEVRYGKEYLSDAPRQFANKVRNAQEAHEAIRPAGTAMKTAQELGLSGQEHDVYDLIWKRTLASQMAEAVIRQTTVHLEANTSRGTARFRASGREVVFPGFFRAYVEGSDDPEAALENRESPLPPLTKGVDLPVEKLEAKGHETRPPARFTEASLIKLLEEEGIGRPSTYASIIDTIVRRGYVQRNGSQLVPTFTAFATTNLLEQQFGPYVDTGFTAEMEQILDDIATGKRESVPYLTSLYVGENGLESMVEKGLDSIDAREVSGIQFEKWSPFVVRVGKYGPYVEQEVDGERVVASIPPDVAPGDLTRDSLQHFIDEKQKGDEVLGIHSELDMPVFVKKGPYGHYVQLGDDEQEGKPKRISVPRNMDPSAIDLGAAQRLLELPRELGQHPETGATIKAHIGRYGPYVQHNRTFASLTKDDDVLTVDFDRALELIARKEAKNKPLRSLGVHPETGDPLDIFEGRYGPYVKHGRTNASLPKDRPVESISLEEAVALVDSKAKTRKSSKKKAVKKSTTKKPAAKKPAAKKVAAKKKTKPKK
ncbi:MAG: DNA topoisomerase I [Bacteroidetes bacterium CG12_big_fil_rev_8_21_14_0_65_60_17]|nr:MAG: DNA topoisomerase I [Bacteroidetes bacterium CG12_big_fil_rev_8_21_14_0_65_60_17]